MGGEKDGGRGWGKRRKGGGMLISIDLETERRKEKINETRKPRERKERRKGERKQENSQKLGGEF